MPLRKKASSDMALQGQAEEVLYEALISLQSPEEAKRFIADLCTPAEVRALAERWHVARLLDATDLSYREIHSETGVSTTTIARVARFLNNEPHKGYRLVLDRTNRK